MNEQVTWGSVIPPIYGQHRHALSSHPTSNRSDPFHGQQVICFRLLRFVTIVRRFSANTSRNRLKFLVNTSFNLRRFISPVTTGRLRRVMEEEGDGLFAIGGSSQVAFCFMFYVSRGENVDRAPRGLLSIFCPYGGTDLPGDHPRASKDYPAKRTRLSSGSEERPTHVLSNGGAIIVESRG